MLTKFSGTNYKAFKDFSFEIKPITILLGANSCGKSALINSLLMFSQTAETINISESALRLNGNKVGMGESLNVIREKNRNNILSFSFEISDQQMIRHDIYKSKRDFIDFYFSLVRYIGQVLKNAIATSSNTSLDKDKLNEILRIIDEVEPNYMFRDSYNTAQLKTISDVVCGLLSTYRQLPGELTKKSRPHLDRLAEFINIASFENIQNSLMSLASLSAKKISPRQVEYKFSYDKKSNQLKITECSFHNHLGECIANLGISKGKFFLKSNIIKRTPLSKSRDEISKLINFNSLSLINEFQSINFIDKHVISLDPFASLFCNYLEKITKAFISEFNGVKINHVSPLRAFPQRYYLLDKSIQHTFLNALEGTELAEVLKKNPEIKKKINILLAKFNLEVDVVMVNDIIHKINITQDSISLELTDVGFGISQVLPILVQAYLSPKNSITIIEQPEIHLHPKMQAWLTDALINIALKENKRFIIETHSDALIRRIRLRIVDTNSPLTTNDVMLCNLERCSEDNSTNLKIIPITEDGDITWPADFLDVEIQDTIQIQNFKVEKHLKMKGSL
ncbi:AAA family ATPase [Dickeya zeae]|uniref:AAA family ATPase n=1 Tax=Dickeya zeae TaxID=204042 RepID=UPI00036C53B2|nr:AAA family ATPase [Dickeya zeae]UJR53050.1 AAA family ATPase [Dickeya zeae MS1]